MKSSFLILLIFFLLSASFGYCQDSGDYFVGAAQMKKAENYAGAIANCTHIIESDPNFALLNEVYGIRGDSKRMLKDYSGAIVDLTIAIRLCPKCSSDYYNRALAKLGLGQKAAASYDFGKAGDLGDKQAYEMIVKYCQ